MTILTIGSEPGSSAFFGIDAIHKRGQTFTSIGTVVETIRVWLTTSTFPADNLQIKIFTVDAGHLPDSQLGVTSNALAGSSLTETRAPYDFTFSTPVTVTNGDEFCFFIERTGALVADPGDYDVFLNGTSTYSGGQQVYLTGSGWQVSSTSDVVSVIDQGGASLRPSADVSIVDWETGTGSGSNLYAEIDESLFSSSDYIATEGGTAKFELTNPSAGIVAATMRVRFRKDGDDEANLTVRLLQNDGGSETVVAEWEYTDIADTDVDEEVALTAPQFALITDPSDLRVEFEASVAPAPDYQGPGDVASGWIAYYGLRAFSSAAIGQTVVLLERDNDLGTLAVTTGADGNLDLVTAGYVAWAGGNSISVKTIYDQVGGSANDLTSATGIQPQFFPTGGLGGLPTMRFVNASSLRFTCTGIAQSQPYSMVTVAKHNDASAGQSLFADNTASVAFYYYATGDDQVVLWAGGGAVQPVACTDDAWHSVQSIFSSTSSTITVDGSTSSSGVAIGTAALSTGTWGLGSYPAVGQYFDGDCAEFGILAGALSGGDLAAIYANQDAYYVIP